MDEHDQPGREEELKRPHAAKAQSPEEAARTAEPGLNENALRERAEALLPSHEDAWEPPLTDSDILGLVHELQVHQVELEIQNEELRRAQLDLAASVERYTDLYDFAPIGYISVNLDGQITGANLAAANMLGGGRSLTGKPLRRFVAPDDFDLYQGTRRRLIIAGLKESVELRLRPAGGQTFWARLEIATRLDPTQGAVLWRVAISNIDAQKRAEILSQRVNEELEARVSRRTEQLRRTNKQLVEEVGGRRQAEAELREREELLERRVAERTAELAAMLAVAREITSTLQIDRVLDIILDQLRHIVRYDGCGIFLLNGEVLTLVAYNGSLGREEVLQSQTTLHRSPLLQEVVKSGEPVIIADVLASIPRTADWQATAGALERQLLHKSRAWMGVPMVAQGQLVGVLRLDHGTPGYFTQHHAELVLTLAGQAAIAVVNARLYAQAQRAAAIEERQRLARELHDSVAQTFYSIALATHSAKALLSHHPGMAERRLGHILELAEAGLTEMRALIFDLRTEGIRRDGLVEALRQHVDALIARDDIRVQAELGSEPALSLKTKEAIYGIVREALQNVVRHANATELYVKLGHSDDAFHLEVRDNGRGFSTETAGTTTLGLRSMRERASAVGGTVEISSTPGEGSMVRAWVPLRKGDTESGRNAE